jgi:hypothetical protein
MLAAWDKKDSQAYKLSLLELALSIGAKILREWLPCRLESDSLNVVASLGVTVKEL